MDNDTPPDAPRGLIRKLAEVMAAVERVPKRGRNEFHRYDYATEADIVATVRDELSKRGVMLIPAVQNHERHELRDGIDSKTGKDKPRDPVTILHMTFTFVDGETGERETHPWLGAGQDGGDKGVYKAMTGAAKYFLMKTFLMPTGDDPETEGKKEARRREREMDQAARSQQRAAAPPPPPKDTLIDRAQQKELASAAETFHWRVEDVKRLLAAHGFKRSGDVTREALPRILDELKNGAVVPVTPELGVVAPENALVV